MELKKKNTAVVAVVGILVVAVMLVLGTFWMGQTAKEDTEEAVRSVSLLYLDELAGRREQVIEENLNDRITDMQTAIDMLEDEDLRDAEHLQAYQTRVKQYFTLERFAFVGKDGLIYTSTGTVNDIADYDFNYKTISGPEISIKEP